MTSKSSDPEQGYVNSGYGGRQVGGLDINDYVRDPNAPPKTGVKLSGFGESFTDAAIRRTFIKKVYAIILTQLAFTAGVIALFAHTPAIRNWYLSDRQTGLTLYIVSYVVFLVTYIMIVCCSSLRRKFPANLITLFVFTCALSFMMGSIAIFHDTDWLWMAMGITAAICVALTIFAFQTKYDFTGWGIYLYGMLICVLIFGIVAIIFWQTHRPILHAVYCGLIGLVFSCYLIFDTQRIMGGKKHSISAEEHIFAAVQIYIDVVQIFLAVLGMGRSS